MTCHSVIFRGFKLQIVFKIGITSTSVLIKGYEGKFAKPVTCIQVSDHPEILERFPRAEFQYIEGAGHWVHAQKPAEFLDIVLDNLK